MSPTVSAAKTKPIHASQAEIDAAQLRFDWLIPFQHKQLLTTSESARCLGRSENFVRELVETGKLEAFRDSAFGDRESLRITRRSVVVHLARTYHGDPEDFLATLTDVVCRLPLPSRNQIATALQHTFSHL